MDRLHYEEMASNLELLLQNNRLNNKHIYLFGHCNASEELADLLVDKGYQVQAILDNNIAKQDTFYKDTPIVSPERILEEAAEQTVVCIVARAYEAMFSQLRQMGYAGPVEKLVNYDSFAEYSLSPETIAARQARVNRGIERLNELKAEYPCCFQIFCPFSALGDVYFAMSYLPYFLKRRNVEKYVVYVVGRGCADVVKLFGTQNVKALKQQDMDEVIQAVLYTEDAQAYIAHHDRPYVVNLAKALYVKMIPLEMLYRCGVYGLSKNSRPIKPTALSAYGDLDKIIEGRAVILSPHAKSVTNIKQEYWQQIIAHYQQLDYQLFTNVVGAEEALQGTERLEVPLDQMHSVVERAGTFIGLRSGLCDVIRDANCKKIALYPNCYYSDTKWKMEEIYHLDGWENIVVE